MFTRVFCGRWVGVFALLIGFAGVSAWADTKAESSVAGGEIGGQSEAQLGEEAQGARVHESEHGQHDPFDLSHANASSQLQRPDEWRYDMALCTFVVFVLLLAVLTAFAWKPIMEALEKRESGIAARIEEAERGARQAAERLKQYEAKLAAAADEAAGIVAKGRREAEAMADRIRDEAHQDAAKERQRASADIQAAKNAALGEITRQTADMAILLAGRIVRREISAEEHATLISDALKHFPSNN